MVFIQILIQDYSTVNVNVCFFPLLLRIDPALKSTVYCSGVASGDEDEWNFVYNKYKTATVAAEKARLLSALSCTKQTWILNR